MTQTTAIRDLAVATDTELARLYRDMWEARSYLDISIERREGMLNPKRPAYAPAFTAADLARVEAEIAERTAKVAEIARAQRPLEAIYAEHRWTRAFLVVTSGGGHVHRSMSCVTCYPTTQFSWLPNYSGADETAIVEDAGERACTVCYPSAPVEVLARPSRIFSDDERTAQAAREERLAAKIARDAAKAAKAPTKDGTPLTITESSTAWDGTLHTRRVEINTERTAVSTYMDLAYYLSFLPADRAGEIEAKKNAMYEIEKALAGKHGVDVAAMREVLAIKVAAKAKKEARA